MGSTGQGSRRSARPNGEQRHNDDTAVSVPAARFKAQCLSWLERVRQSRQAIIVAKHGRPVAKVVPLRTPPRAILGFSKGTVKILGDIVAPTGERWDADAD